MQDNNHTVSILAHVKTIRNCYEKRKDSFGVFVECNI